MKFAATSLLLLGIACQQPRPLPSNPLPPPTPASQPAVAPAASQPAPRPAASQPASRAAKPPNALTLPKGAPLKRFFGRLAALEAKERDRVRVSVWGASHVAGEAFTGQLRRRFQKDFGDGGPGWVIPGRPWRSYRHSTVRLGEKGRWRSERIWSRYSRRRREPRDDLFGLGGISVYTRWGASAWLELRKRRPLSVLDIYYLRQAGGGGLDVYAGDKRLRRLRTAARRKKRAAFARLELPAKTRRIELRARGGEVRFFGVDLQSGQPGVVVDAFGINGGRADRILEWNEALLKRQVERLAPDLMILAYGSNSVDNDQLTPTKLARQLHAALQRMRAAAPDADCVFIGPADQARKDDEGVWQVPANLTWIIATQRRVAHARGCAYWDWRAAMGGEKSVFAAVSADPPLSRKDHLHFFVRGYGRYADAFYEALMAKRPSSAVSQPAPLAER